MKSEEPTVPVFKQEKEEHYKMGTKLEGYEKITPSDPEVKMLMDDPSLKKVFYGVNYAPQKVQDPGCGTTQRDVTLDLAVLSQVTNRVRMFSTDCNQVDFVLNAIEDLGLDMTVSMGVWVDRSFEASKRQLKEMKRLVSSYPARHFDSILIGNEVLFRQEMTEDELIAHIDTTRAFLKSKDIYIPVGTSEIGARWNDKLGGHVDVLAASIHPFFGGVRANESTKWINDYLYSKMMVDMSQWEVVPETIVISEVGWPSGGGKIRDSVAGIPEMQVLLNDWLCPKDTTGSGHVGWYWYEAFDEPSRESLNTLTQRWETQWGLFGTNRRLKAGLQLPNCEELLQGP